MTTTFTTDAAAALAGPDWLRAATRRRGRAAAAEPPCPPPTRRSGATAASTSSTSTTSLRSPSGRPPPACPTGAPSRARRAARRRAGAVVVRNGLVVHAELDPAVAERRACASAAWPTTRRPRPAARLGRRSSPPTSSRCSTTPSAPIRSLLSVPARRRHRRARSWSSTGSTPTASATFPRLVVQLGEDAEADGARVARAAPTCRRSSCPSPSSTSAQAARLRYLDVQHRGPRTWQIAHPGLAGSSAGRHPGRGPGRPRRRVRPHPHRLPARRPGRHRRPAGRLLRRGRPDARLPHLPGPRRPRHHLEPAVQGRGRRRSPARSTPGSSRCDPRPGAPTPSRPTATSS